MIDDQMKSAREAFVTGFHGSNLWHITLIIISMGLSVFYSNFLTHIITLKTQFYAAPSTIELTFLRMLSFTSLFFVPLLGVLIADPLYLFSLLIVQFFTIGLTYISFPLIAVSAFPAIQLDQHTFQRIPFSTGYNLENAEIPNERTKIKFTVPSPNNNYQQCQYLSLYTPETKSSQNRSNQATLPPQNISFWEREILTFFTPALTKLRVSLFILTTIAILAVDFHIFPRFHCKTEFLGISLMDIGVGGFVFSNVITHPIARYGLLYTSPGLTTLQLPNFFNIIVKSMRSIFPLFMIGVARMVVIKTLNYQVHLSEYGVHWNFFFTLFFILFFISVLYYLITLLFPTINNKKIDHNVEKSEIQSFSSQTFHNVSILTILLLLTIGLIYLYNTTLSSPLATFNYILSVPPKNTAHITLEQWLLINERDMEKSNFLELNKEGIFSLFGYLILSLCTIIIGRIINNIQLYFIYDYYDSSLKTELNNINQENKKLCYKTRIARAQMVFTSIITIILLTLIIAGVSQKENSFGDLLTSPQYFDQYYNSIDSTILSRLFDQNSGFNLELIPQVSRRLCNVWFILWILFISTLLLTFTLANDAIFYLCVDFRPVVQHYKHLKQLKFDGDDQNRVAPNHQIIKTVKKQTNSVTLTEEEEIARILRSIVNNNHTNAWSYNIDMVMSYNNKAIIQQLVQNPSQLSTMTSRDVGSSVTQHKFSHLASLATQVPLTPQDHHNTPTPSYNITHRNKSSPMIIVQYPPMIVREKFEQVEQLTALRSRRINVRRRTTLVNKDILLSYSTSSQLPGIRENDKYNSSNTFEFQKIHPKTKIALVDDFDGYNDEDNEKEYNKIIVQPENLIESPKISSDCTTQTLNRKAVKTVLFDPFDYINNINSNAFQYFLFSNLCTGLCNLLIDTMAVSNIYATMVILVVYLCVSYLLTIYISKVNIFRTISWVRSRLSPQLEEHIPQI